jgi:hypothetical protein
MHSPAEIAELIRDKFDPDYAQKVHPDEQHLHNTAVEVAKHLDVEPTALMVNHISGLIAQHIGRPSAEFPKMLYHHTQKKEAVVANAAEEGELVRDGWVHHHWSAPQPEQPRREPVKAVTSQSHPDGEAEAPHATAPAVHVDDLMGGPSRQHPAEAKPKVSHSHPHPVHGHKK